MISNAKLHMLTQQATFLFSFVTLCQILLLELPGTHKPHNTGANTTLKQLIWVGFFLQYVNTGKQFWDDSLLDLT